MMRLHKILLTLVCFTVLSAHAQWKWLNPLECGFPVIQNQGWTEEIGDRYVRLPQRAEGKVRKPVWDLSRNSAGLAIHFFSNAPELKVSSKRTAEYATYAHDRRIRCRSI